MVPSGTIRIAVIDQDERGYDLVLHREGGRDVVVRIPPAGPDHGEEMLIELDPGRYVLRAEMAPTGPLEATFVVQPAQ